MKVTEGDGLLLPYWSPERLRPGDHPAWGVRDREGEETQEDECWGCEVRVSGTLPGGNCNPHFKGP